MTHLILVTVFKQGGEEFPNGYVNGSAKPFMNGGLSKKPMHIRENPQVSCLRR